MRTLYDLMENHPVFHDFPKAFVKELAECTWEMEFQKDQYIFWSGGDAEYFYFVRDGAVDLIAQTEEQGRVTIETLESGDVLGWSWLYPPHRWHYDAQATKPTHVIVLDGKRVLEKCRANHELGYELMSRFGRIMLERLMYTRKRLLEEHEVHA